MQVDAAKLSDLSIMLAMPASGPLQLRVVSALLETADMLRGAGISAQIVMEPGGGTVISARNMLCQRFLETNFSRMFWVDYDIVWTGADFIRMLGLSTELECVSAIYPKRTDPVDFFLNAPLGVMTANAHRCFEVNGLGLGFTVVHRKVIEQLAAKVEWRRVYESGPKVPLIFRNGEYSDLVQTEDFCFFEDVRALGYKVNLNPSINLGHMGTKIFEGRFLDSMKKVPAEVAA